MRDILEGICAKKLSNSVLEQLPTELFFQILSFSFDDCTGTWFHLRLVSRQFFALLDHSFVKLFNHIHFEVFEDSLTTWLEWARSTRLRSYVHSITLCYDVPDTADGTGRFLLQNPNNVDVNFVLEDMDRKDKVLVNTEVQASNNRANLRLSTELVPSGSIPSFLIMRTAEPPASYKTLIENGASTVTLRSIVSGTDARISGYRTGSER